MARLVNSNMTDMVSQVDQYKKTVQEAFYQHYKNIYILKETNNFRGEGSNAYKTYLTGVTINYINAFINIAEEVSTALRKINSSYTSIESSAKGSIDTDVIDNVRKALKGKNNEFQLFSESVNSLNNSASKYISIQKLNTSVVMSRYQSIDRELYNTCNNLTRADSVSCSAANQLMDRIRKLTSQLNSISKDYHADNKISIDNVDEISKEPWYNTELDNNLGALIKEDAFYFDANAKYSSEGQWARGFATDTYGYAGYSVWGNEYTMSKNNNVRSIDYKLSAFDAYAKGQVTDYAKANFNISAGTLGVMGKLGASKDFFGLQAEGSTALVDVNASAVLGTDRFNGYIKGSASALSANGNIDLYYQPKNGDFKVGIGGDASLAKASFTAGGSFLSVNKQNPDWEVKSEGGVAKASGSTSLLGVSVTGSVGAGVSAGVNISSTEVLDFGPVNINAINIDLGAMLVLGLKINITIPLPTFDMPWED